MDTIPFIEFSLYEMFHIFIFWAFVGWCIEVCYMPDLRLRRDNGGCVFPTAAGYVYTAFSGDGSAVYDF